MTRSNLGAESQGWVRDMEKRISTLESEARANSEFRRNMSATMATQMNTLDRLKNTSIMRSSGIEIQSLTPNFATYVEQFADVYTVPAWATTMSMRYITSGTFSAWPSTAITMNGSLRIGIGSTYAEAEANARDVSADASCIILWSQGVYMSANMNQLASITEHQDVSLSVTGGQTIHVVGKAIAFHNTDSSTKTLTLASQSTATFI